MKDRYKASTNTLRVVLGQHTQKWGQVTESETKSKNLSVKIYGIVDIFRRVETGKCKFQFVLLVKIILIMDKRGLRTDRKNSHYLYHKAFHYGHTLGSIANCKKIPISCTENLYPPIFDICKDINIVFCLWYKRRGDILNQSANFEVGSKIVPM